MYLYDVGKDHAEIVHLLSEKHSIHVSLPVLNEKNSADCVSQYATPPI